MHHMKCHIIAPLSVMCAECLPSFPVYFIPSGADEGRLQRVKGCLRCGQINWHAQTKQLEGKQMVTCVKGAQNSVQKSWDLMQNTQVNTFSGCKLLNTNEEMFLCKFEHCCEHVREQCQHNSWLVPTCLSARSMSIPWFQGAAGLARQSPALPRRLMSIFCRRRVRKASAITRTPS